MIVSNTLHKKSSHIKTEDLKKCVLIYWFEKKKTL